MEFFVPSLVIFLIIAVAVVAVIPRMSPLILVIMASIMLAFGIYTHYNTFAAEYKESTFFDNFKTYAPGIMIATIIVFLLFAIASFFTKGTVPIPSIPIPAILPPANTATNTLTSTINNSINNKSDISNTNTSTNANINLFNGTSRNSQANANQYTTNKNNTSMKNLPILL